MSPHPCPECRHDVPVAPWCNWCGARLAGPAREPPGSEGRRWGRLVGAIAVAVGVGVVGVGVATSTGGPGDTSRSAEGEVVLDGPVRSPDRAGAVLVARPGGPPLDPVPSEQAPPEPRTDVVCSDLQVRSVPTDELATTEEGELVELAHGPCVVMGPEGAAVP